MGKDSFEIDTSLWPIVVMRLKGSLTTEDYASVLDASEEIASRRLPYVGIVDLRELTTAANASQRQLIATRIREMEAAYGETSVGNVMIVTSALVRGALTAVEWLRFRKKRDLWVGSMDDAMSAATSIAREHGLPSPRLSKPA